MKTGSEINSVDVHWLSKIDRPPWIDVCVIRHCTVRSGEVTSVTTAVVGTISWISDMIDTALICRSVQCCVVRYHRRVYYKQCRLLQALQSGKGLDIYRVLL